MVIIKNYTGDLINFKAAVDMIKAQYGPSHGVNIRTLDVGDDVALLDSQGSMKPRGVAGTVLVYKILGGAGFKGKNLDHLCELGDYVMKNMGTMGVSMLSCSLPGQALSHPLGENQIEIGMGIHGEKGKYVCDWMECKELVGKILTSLNDHEAIKAGLQDSNSEWIAMVNNLGCVTNLEMTLIVNEFT